ncbi:hypothetical protein XELAEV_18042300mg [Xenopus laevis]|uniref:Uncharacterized protein n=1 Tax=Xenopus laevis TaxID=8355 RepID=A0A974C4Z8_XENLA|nr:hypothetical protein XELAEV_18042300mg [Xenopus laevis]
MKPHYRRHLKTPRLLSDVTSGSDVTKPEVGPGREPQQRARTADEEEQGRRWRRTLGRRGTVPVCDFSNLLP